MSLLPDEISKAIDCVAAVVRATRALDRARDGGVRVDDAWLVELREQAREPAALLDRWASELLGQRWRVKIGDRFTLTDPGAHLHIAGELRGARCALRIQDFVAFPQIELSVAVARATAANPQLFLIDAIGPSSDALKLAALGTDAHAGEPPLIVERDQLGAGAAAAPLPPSRPIATA